MNKLIKVTFLVLMLFEIGQMVFGAKIYKKWKNAKTVCSSTENVQIKSITFTDTATIIDLLAVNNPTDIVFKSSTFLLCDSITAMIKSVKGYELGKMIPVANKTVPLTLIFNPLPKKTERFELIGGLNPNDLRFLGITDGKKPYQVKPYAYNDHDLDSFRQNFYHTDTATIRGRMIWWPEEGIEGFGLLVDNSDAVTMKEDPWVINVNKDGTFEHKMVISQPVLRYASDDSLSVQFPFFIEPGQTLDIEIYSTGMATYKDASGKALEWGNIGLFSPQLFNNMGNVNDKVHADKVNFKEFAQIIENKRKELLKALDYVAEMAEYSSLDYQLAKCEIDAVCSECLFVYIDNRLGFQDIKKVYVEAMADERREMFNPDNYFMLREMAYNDPLLTSVPCYSTLENSYQYAPILCKEKYFLDEEDAFYEVERAKRILEIDKKIFGSKLSSVLMKSAMLNDLLTYASCCSEVHITFSDSIPLESQTEQLKLVQKLKEDMFCQRVLLIDNPFFQHLALKAWADAREEVKIHELPDCEATIALRKLTDKYL